MDDYQAIEFLDTLRLRLQADLPDLDTLLDDLQRCDYRRASTPQLQLALAEIAFNLNATSPADARELQRRIALAESDTHTPAPHTAAGNTTTPAWNLREPAAATSVATPAQPAISRSLRYLALPALSAAAPGNPTNNLLATAAPAIPTRFGHELARCTSVRNALELVRKRLPALKGNAAYRFLSAIGYPVAVPSPDAMRFASYLGLVPATDNARDFYMAMLDHASRAAAITVARAGYLLRLYAEDSPDHQHQAICHARKPRCGTCPFTARCSYYARQRETKPAPETEPRRRPVKDWTPDERPRERFLAGERLSTSELLAIILRTGTGRLSAVELARELIHEFATLHDLEKATPQEIVDRMKGKGIGPAKAVEICAAIELGRRVTQPAADTRLGQKQIGGSRDVFELCRARYKTATQEEFLLLVLNTKNRLQKEIPVSLGTLNASLVHPRDVFRHALKEAAAAVIFVHNHPSGDPTPSNEDILLTSRLVDVGKLLGIQVLDHVIIGSHEWYSFADHGRI